MNQEDNINRDQTFDQLVSIVDQISKIEAFPPLGWVWCFDVIKDIFDNNQFQDATVTDFECIAEGVTLKQIFDKFWIDSDSLGLTMDYGGEIIEEAIRDWMADNDFLVALDDDSWLDSETNQLELELDNSDK